MRWLRVQAWATSADRASSKAPSTKVLRLRAMLRLAFFLALLENGREAVVQLQVWDLNRRDRQAQRAQLSGAV